MKICKKCYYVNEGDSKFCKRCGNPLVNTDNLVLNNKMQYNKNNYFLIMVIIVICIFILFGTFFYISNLNNNLNTNQLQFIFNQDSNNNLTNSSLQIISGTISTGSDDNDLSYCKVYLGLEHAGEPCKISTLYSRNGNSLNNGNIIDKVIDSNGYVSVPSAYAFKYYPDYCIIKIYDSNGVLQSTKYVTLKPTEGTQYF